MQYVSADVSVRQIASGQRVFVPGAAASPHRLVQAMCQVAAKLRRVEIVQRHTESGAPYAALESRAER